MKKKITISIENPKIIELIEDYAYNNYLEPGQENVAIEELLLRYIAITSSILDSDKYEFLPEEIRKERILRERENRHNNLTFKI